MDELIRLATPILTQFLCTNLPDLSDAWWQKHVLDRLTFQQQRVVRERRHTKLTQLDFAALLRVVDQNWYELSGKLALPREARTWIKELQTVRNKWAHLSSEEISPSELYRDTDTLCKVLSVVGAPPESLATLENAKAAALRLMTKRSLRGSADTSAGGARGSDHGGGGTTGTGDPGAAQRSEAPCAFAIGDLVSLRSDPTSVMAIIEVLAGAGECRYKVFQNGTKAIFYESQLQAARGDERTPTLSADDLRAYLTSLHLLSPSTANLFSLRSGRVEFVPYQYRPVLKLIRSDRPRLLIADEVGVGKTIEAGLIIKELRARMDLSSVLIICPKPLVAERKWFLEMKRFDEQFTALDGKLLRHCLHETHLDGEWPEQYAKAILPFSLFDSEFLFGRSVGGGRHEGLTKLDPPPKFDLVIVDEAHHIRNRDTLLHQGIRYFCDNADAVLFLTATPVQLGSEDLYTLLNVLRPDLVIDTASFEQMAEPNRHINAAVHHCRAAQEGWQLDARTSLDEAAETEWGRLFLRESTAFQDIHDRLSDEPPDDAERVRLTRSIEALYTFGSLISRTRRRDIGDFTTRKPETRAVEFTPAQKELHDGLLDVVARILVFCHGQQNVKFLMTTIRRQAASCLYGLAPLLKDILAGKLDRLELMQASDDEEMGSDLTFVEQVRTDIAALLEQASSLDPHDPKVEAFVQVLNEKGRLPNNKAMVFSTFRHTLAYLARYVSRAGLRYGLIHGGVPDDERSELRRRFALPKDDPVAMDVLLSSEVGCEGLDFQFCDCIVNYDLPWNPMRIEQRIGRIDRYGQRSEAVAIVNFVTPGTVDAEIYDRCLWRIGVFQHAVGGTEEILGAITQELHDIAESFDLTPQERERRLRQLADNSIRQMAEERELESRQAELFGLSIPNASWQEDVEAAESRWLSPEALQRCVLSYLSKRLGTGQEQLLGEKALKTLRLSQEARTTLLEDYKRLPRSNEPVFRAWEKWLKGGLPTLSVTFDQETAVENPQSVHLSVTHPLVRQAAQHLSLDEAAHALLEVRGTGIPPGDYPFGIYRWTKRGVRRDETLTPVALHPALEEVLLAALETATTREGSALPDGGVFDALDAQHHGKWTAAQANHIAENRQQVEHRIQSLTVSHRARCKAIEDQLDRAKNDRIRVMKQSELARANMDFDRRMHELEQAASSGDIHAMPVLFGVLTVVHEE